MAAAREPEDVRREIETEREQLATAVDDLRGAADLSAALRRGLARHNSNASLLYSSVFLALLRAGLLNCVFMWASFRVLSLCPLSVKSMQPQSTYLDYRSSDLCPPVKLAFLYPLPLSASYSPLSRYVD